MAGAKTHPCLTPTNTSNGSDSWPPTVTLADMPSWNSRRIWRKCDGSRICSGCTASRQWRHWSQKQLQVRWWHKDTSAVHSVNSRRPVSQDCQNKEADRSSAPSPLLPPLSLEVGPLNPARGSGGALYKLLQRGQGWSPSRILDFGAF